MMYACVNDPHILNGDLNGYHDCAQLLEITRRQQGTALVQYQSSTSVSQVVNSLSKAEHSLS